MWVYVDETGHTGSNLFDKNQPIFYSSAFITKTNFDVLASSYLSNIKSSLQIKELHANELGVGELTKISTILLDIIKNFDCAFVFSQVTKKHLVATKLVDSLMDPGINKSVPWHIYNLKPLRLILVFKFHFLINEKISRIFFDVLLGTNVSRGKKKLDKVLKNLISKIGSLPDERSREIFRKALEWAKNNKDLLDLFGGSSKENYGHLPNLVGFPNILRGVDHYAKKWNQNVKIIKHDLQSQFGPQLKQYHERFSQAVDQTIQNSINESINLQYVPNSKFKLVNSTTSIGLQFIDTILWLYKRNYELKNLSQELVEVLNEVKKRGIYYDLSLETMHESIIETFDHIERKGLTTEQIEESKKLLEKFNKDVVS